MVNILTQKVGLVFNPLIQNTNQSYQALATQIGRITYFFASPQPVHQQIPQIQYIPQIQNPQPLQIIEHVVQRDQLVPQPQHVEQ
jgi:hypothetical protein